MTNALSIDSTFATITAFLVANDANGGVKSARNGGWRKSDVLDYANRVAELRSLGCVDAVTPKTIDALLDDARSNVEPVVEPEPIVEPVVEPAPVVEPVVENDERAAKLAKLATIPALANVVAAVQKPERKQRAPRASTVARFESFMAAAVENDEGALVIDCATIDFDAPKSWTKHPAVWYVGAVAGNLLAERGLVARCTGYPNFLTITITKLDDEQNDDDAALAAK